MIQMENVIETADVIVIGGGMVGSVMAADLAREPGLTVTLADRSPAALERARARSSAIETVEADLSDPARVRALDFHPYWNVPQSIVRRALLPKLAKDPDYLTRERIRVFSGGRSGGEVAPAELAGAVEGAVQHDVDDRAPAVR